MENKRNIKLLINFIIMGILLVFPLSSFAYSDTTTHPALTNEIVKFFNTNYPDLELDDKEKELVVQGSVDEDAFGRWMRHYYDPVYNRGITVGKKWQSSKEWSQDSKAQAGIIDSAFAGSLKSYYGHEGDYSWERAIYEYTWGDREYGLSALGHILHFIEDATVPPHTRNDIHLVYFDDVFHDRSPYEHWASKFNINNIDVISKLGNKKPIEFDTLDKYFDTVASYTNKNFFSKDTILSKEYSNPVIKFLGKEILSDEKQHMFGYSDESHIRLVRIKNQFKKKEGVSKKLYFIEDPDYLILADYWNILSKQAVLNGAGVVKLFFDEVEKESKTEVLKMKNRSWFKRIYDATVGKIFGISKGLCGSSVSYEDLQGAVVGSQKVAVVSKELTVKKEEPVIIEIESEKEIEVMEDIILVEDEKVKEPATTTEKTLMEIYESRLIPVDTPFFGGGGGGSNNTSDSTSEAVEVKAVVPTLSLTSTECQNTLSVSGCLVATTTLNFSWSSDSNDLDYYLLNQNGAISTTTATSTIITTSDNTAYTFLISVKDDSGNVSATSTQEIEVMTSPIVINEVAWAGTATSSSDEWVELYNKSNKDIDLSQWVFMAEDGVPYIPLSSTISAGGYYLIERSIDDNTISDIQADLAIPFSGVGSGSGLGDSGEHLSLVYVNQNATSTVDEVPLCNFSWCGGSSNSKYTMERYDTDVSGDTATNWGNSIGEFILNGSDAEGAAIKGTPKAKNSISYKIANGTTLSSDKTLTQEDSPYLIDRNGFSVNSGVNLTLEEGVVIKIVNPNTPSIVINGTLKTNGTSANPVVITAFADDEYGGDMNSDATATTPTSGSWKSITINSSSSGSSLTNTIIRHGGVWFDGIGVVKAMVIVDTANVDFQNVTIEHSKKHGLHLTSSASTITNSTFQNNNTDSDSAGLYVSEGSPTISNSTFKDNKYGMYAYYSPNLSASSNTFTNNSIEAVRISGAIGSFSGNTGSGNGTNAITIGNGSNITDTTNGTTTLNANALSYLVQNDARIIASTTLAFGEGVVIKGHNNEASSLGRIIVKDGGSVFKSGSSINDLIFTSIHDDSVGTAVDSDTTSSSAGDWYGIDVENGGTLNLNGFTLRYAGAVTTSSGNDKGGIKFDGGTATSTITNALFDNNYQFGIRLQNSTKLTVSDTTFKNHTEQKVAPATAVWLTDSSIELQDIIFESNDLDIHSFSASTVSCLNCGTPTTDPAGLLP